MEAIAEGQGAQWGCTLRDQEGIRSSVSLGAMAPAIKPPILANSKIIILGNFILHQLGLLNLMIFGVSHDTPACGIK